jgi:hypothetical protein
MVSPVLAVISEQASRLSGKAKRGFSRWPIRAASLRALCDLGLTDAKIAEYLKISPQQVKGLRVVYCIAEGRWRG